MAISLKAVIAEALVVHLEEVVHSEFRDLKT